jgi:hypothetical protein
MNVFSGINLREKEMKIEEVLLSKRFMKNKENYSNSCNIPYHKSKTEKRKYSNVLIGSVVTGKSNLNKHKLKKKKSVSFSKNFLEFIDVVSYKEFNKENCFEPEIEVMTTDTSCKLECKILNTKCLIF